MKIIKKKHAGAITQKVLGSNSKSIYILDLVVGRGKQILLEYDYELNLVRQTPLNFKYERKKVKFKRLLKIKGGNYLIGISENGKKNKNTIHYLDMKKDLVRENLQIIATYKYDQSVFATSERDRDEDASLIRISQDSSLFIFGRSLTIKEKPKEEEDYQFLVFNDRMDLQFKRQSSFGLKDNDIDVKDYEINNDGDIWVTGKVKGNFKIYKLLCEKEFEELAFYPEKYVSEKYSSI